MVHSKFEFSTALDTKAHKIVKNHPFLVGSRCALTLGFVHILSGVGCCNEDELEKPPISGNAARFNAAFPCAALKVSKRTDTENLPSFPLTSRQRRLVLVRQLVTVRDPVEKLVRRFADSNVSFQKDQTNSRSTGFLEHPCHTSGRPRCFRKLTGISIIARRCPPMVKAVSKVSAASVQKVVFTNKRARK